MDVDPNKVIEILARRLAGEIINSAVKEAAIEQLQDKDGGGEDS